MRHRRSLHELPRNRFDGPQPLSEASHGIPVLLQLAIRQKVHPQVRRSAKTGAHQLPSNLLLPGIRRDKKQPRAARIGKPQRQIQHAHDPGVDRSRMLDLNSRGHRAAFLKPQVFCRIDKFAGHAKLETWVYRVAVNEALQHLRRTRRHPAGSLQWEPVDQRPDRSEQLEQRDVLRCSLQRLDPGLRCIFLLREVDELFYREIAPADRFGAELHALHVVEAIAPTIPEVARHVASFPEDY